MTSAIVKSASGKLLQRRAIQCSFSSVFHLRGTGEGGVGGKSHQDIEQLFLTSVGIPLGIMGIAGCASVIFGSN